MEATELIIIGGAGGAIAGLSVWLMQELKEWTIEYRHKKRVFDKMTELTNLHTIEWPSHTIEVITMHTNLPIDRVTLHLQYPS